MTRRLYRLTVQAAVGELTCGHAQVIDPALCRRAYDPVAPWIVAVQLMTHEMEQLGVTAAEMEWSCVPFDLTLCEEVA